MLIRIRNTCCRHTLHVPGSSLSFTCHLYPSCVIPPSMCRPFVHALSHFRHFPRVAHPSTGTCRPFSPRVGPSLHVSSLRPRVVPFSTLSTCRPSLYRYMSSLLSTCRPFSPSSKARQPVILPQGATNSHGDSASIKRQPCVPSTHPPCPLLLV